ncbi:isochorismatase family protein [Curtobacterium sp. NPDC098951]|uniref:isochorismatase family protein n=1 Tax=Curtobacterium sp. NPDC098951 TaxID=3363974 RepID=UPI003823A212
MSAATALLVIDLQRGVVRDCFDAEGVLARTARLVDRAGANDVAVLWVRDHGSFAEGSADWELAAPLERRAHEPIVRRSIGTRFRIPTSTRSWNRWTCSMSSSRVRRATTASGQRPRPRPCVAST